MPLVVIVENGTGVAGANSYASRADGDAYHEAHLFPDVWTGASDTQKDAALVMATRVIDAQIRFKGLRVTQTQALEWPRGRVPYEGGETFTMGLLWASNWWPDNEVPKCLRDATCELARILLAGDRTAETGYEGVKRINIGQSAVAIDFDPDDRPGILTPMVLSTLSPIGQLKGTGMIRTVRR